MDAVTSLEQNSPRQAAILAANRDDITNTEGLLRYDLARFRAWRCHTDTQFRDWFNAVQKWQTQRLKQTHAHLLLDERYQAVTQFFLSDMYGGLDLTVLANEIERALPTTIRLLPDSVMRTAAVALELNAITGDLDEKVASYIFETLKATEVNEDVMSEAYRHTGSRELRQRQMDLARELGTGLDKYVRNRIIYATFKIASKPLHMAGLGGLYDFLDRGFAAMRPMGSAQEFLDMFISREEAIMNKLYNNESNPYQV
ncbi:FFLEELY motif protein [Agitococcus lubricus]|uniref:DUF8198 domain-containing protein n=1 Tax=Agitococcus lubricus TaxID=1077255 RepID=A0A2T5IWE4_9GAMM|nr:hypothetical protein C8N29_11456 [Agitococcus lubricus]